MPLALFLVGVPGSGKTTFRKEYLQGFSVVSLDDHLERIAEKEGIDYNHAFKEHSSSAYHAARGDLIRFAREGKDIVIDMTNLTDKSRLEKACLITRFSPVLTDEKYNFLVVFFPTPDTAELKKRLNSRPGKTIPDNVMHGMLESLEMPKDYMTPGYFIVLQKYFKKKDI